MKVRCRTAARSPEYRPNQKVNGRWLLSYVIVGFPAVLVIKTRTECGRPCGGVYFNTAGRMGFSMKSARILCALSFTSALAQSPGASGAGVVRSSSGAGIPVARFKNRRLGYGIHPNNLSGYNGDLTSAVFGQPTSCTRQFLGPAAHVRFNWRKKVSF